MNITTQEQTKIDEVKTLSAAEEARLKRQWAAEEKAAKRKREDDIDAYKDMIDETVLSLAPDLADFGTLQNLKVDETFDAFKNALALKKELYDYKDSQSSHTFTARNGMASICIGYNEIIGFDGTENAGVMKIREFITTLGADDENREILADLLETFMKPNKKGELNPTRVVELISRKDKINKPLFSDGVDIIVKAQFKTRTSTFVKGWFKRINTHGKEVKLEFSISTK